MDKDLLLQFIFQALDKVVTDELMAKGKAELIKAMKDMAAKTPNKVDDYLAKKVARFLEV